MSYSSNLELSLDGLSIVHRELCDAQGLGR